MHQIASVLVSDPEDCTNAGPACFGCPCYDQCEQHYEED